VAAPASGGSVRSVRGNSLRVPITLTKAGPRALRPVRSGFKVTLRLTQPGASPAPKSVTLRLRPR
jgi:hypothetical protein